MAYIITKISGVLFVLDSTNTNPKSYFGATGKFQASDDNTSALITIYGSNGVILDQYKVVLGSVTVGTSTPSTMSSLLVLLNAIFGS
jgi:hypothetical protein